MAADGALALAVALLGLASGLGIGRNGHLPAGATAVLTAMGLILFARRRFPGTVLAVMAALVASLAITRTSLEAAFIAVLVASYSAAVHGGRLLAQVVLILAVTALLGFGIAQGLGASGWLGAHLPVFRTILAAAGAWLVGLLVRRQLQGRADHIAVLTERAELLAARQQESERRATLAERLRIAREMHDIVAHHISVAVILAQGAQRLADSEPARARAAMADVERTSRTALEEMRRLLGLLRSGEPDAEPPADGAYVPPAGLADITTLADRLRRAGLVLTVVQHGEPAGVPEDVGLTVYRIVQESLTNVLKHAGPADVTVELDFSGQIAVTVTDDGRGASAALADGVPGGGRGTTGMRERVNALGGKLTAGPKPGGGYRVHATIPLESA